MWQVGQGVLGKVRFKDGDFPEYPRTYLVVSVSSTQIGILNISSTAGKEHKLLFPSNKSIKNFEPPFKKDCFVKLDSLTYVPVSEANGFRLLHGGDLLDSTELQSIISAVGA